VYVAFSLISRVESSVGSRDSLPLRRGLTPQCLNRVVHKISPRRDIARPVRGGKNSTACRLNSIIFEMWTCGEVGEVVRKGNIETAGCINVRSIRRRDGAEGGAGKKVGNVPFVLFERASNMVGFKHGKRVGGNGIGLDLEEPAVAQDARSAIRLKI
jgi:hypothetical protein